MTSNSLEELIRPLLSFNISRFSIIFQTPTPWPIIGKESVLRGRLGMNLKRLCCPFSRFREKDCETCELPDKCLYITLFAPTVQFDTSLHIAQNPLFIRPFVFTLDHDEHRDILNPGQTGTITATLFGPTIAYSSLFIEALLAALTSLSLKARDLQLKTPTGAFNPESAQDTLIARPLADWINTGNTDLDHNQIRLTFQTPVRITKNDRQVRDAVTFPLLIQALVRRLRDIKRKYGNDGDMGQISQEVYDQAAQIRITENHLRWLSKKRYSKSQEQDVFLDGFIGDIVFQGQLLPFIPLLQAAEIVHIGKGTSNGCGRMMIMAET